MSEFLDEIYPAKTRAMEDWSLMTTNRK